MEVDQWQNCYSLNWNGFIVPDAMSHPAKFSRGLLNKILSHLFEKEWIKKGSLVLDPFGGVACGGVVCAYKGLKWIGVELEPRFIELGNKNIELHRSKWKHTKCPIPQLLQGDSRKLMKALSEVDCVMISPPYSSLHTNDSQRKSNHKKNDGAMNGPTPYGKSKGQLAELKEGSVDSVISSPPYAAVIKGKKPIDKARKRKTERFNRGEFKSQRPDVFSSEKNIGAKGMFDSCYGDTEGNISQLPEGQTFWEAARDIVLQCYQVLKSGGVAVWVCKDFVRNKQRVPFSDDWLKLCIACGFEPLCRHQAMLVKKSQVIGLDGVRGKDKERKSFFRRLAEKKGSPKIDHEDVLCVIKE